MLRGRLDVIDALLDLGAAVQSTLQLYDEAEEDEEAGRGGDGGRGGASSSDEDWQVTSRGSRDHLLQEFCVFAWPGQR